MLAAFALLVLLGLVGAAHGKYFHHPTCQPCSLLVAVEWHAPPRAARRKGKTPSSSRFIIRVIRVTRF
jgi:hypothetical protein